MFLNRVSRGIILPLVENVRMNKYAQQHAASDISNKFVLFSLLAKFGISVCFSAIHTNYYSAWQYVTKEDSGFIQSFGHPDLMNYHSPRMTFHAHIPQEKQKQFLFAWCTTSLQCLYSFQSPINCGLTKTTPFHNLTLSHPSVLLCNADKCWTFIWDFSLENRIAQFYSLSQ